MPVPDEFNIAPDFTVCVYCNKSYADTEENIHKILVEKNGIKRVYIACVHCILKAKNDKYYDEYMTNKTFGERLGRQIKGEKLLREGVYKNDRKKIKKI